MVPVFCGRNGGTIDVTSVVVIQDEFNGVGLATRRYKDCTEASSLVVRLLPHCCVEPLHSTRRELPSLSATAGLLTFF